MEHQGPPPDPQAPQGTCPNGCTALVTFIEWKDGKEHEENLRCTRCGTVWNEPQPL